MNFDRLEVVVSHHFAQKTGERIGHGRFFFMRSLTEMESEAEKHPQILRCAQEDSAQGVVRAYKCSPGPGSRP